MPRLRLLPPVEAVVTPEQAVPVLQYLMNRGGHIAIDTETTGLRILQDRVLFWSMATEDRRWFFDADVLPIFEPLFRRPDICWYLANAKYDKHILANMGRHLRGEAWDIIVMDAMEDDTRPHGLKEQAKLAYDARWGEFKELFLDPTLVAAELGFDKQMFMDFKKMDVGPKLLRVYNERPDIVEDYATCDAFFTYMRGEDLRRNLSLIPLATEMCPNFNYLIDYFRILEVPLTDALWSMERTGFAVDHDHRKSIDSPMRDGITAAKHKIDEALGWTMANPKSNEEMSQILFDTEKGYGLKPIKYTDTADKSVDEKVLQILMARAGKESAPGRFIGAVLEYRQLIKLHGTYVGKLPGIVYKDHSGGMDKVHCRINQAGARTSRMSSADPNMQNIPSNKDTFGIRGIFCAEPGYDLIDFDYPQIEFRIAAFLAGEEQMMEPIRKGWDIHCANAVNMFPRDGFTYTDIEEARRKKEADEPCSVFEKLMLSRRAVAKVVGLATLYETSAQRISTELKCSLEEAESHKLGFSRAYPAIAADVERMHAFAHEYEFTHTMLGRMRRLHRINNSYSYKEVGAEERQAYNTLVQGTGAEIMKLAILRVHYSKEFQELGGRLILTVHDELIAKCPKETSKEAAAIMKRLMSEPFKWGPIDIDLPVPVDPDGKIGHRWSELK